MKQFSVTLLVCCAVLLKAQLPETDLWLFKVKKDKDIYKLSDGKNITARKGYDNQPYFSPDNVSIMYISIREDNQVEIYKYDISKDVSLKFSNTKVSEYSPIFTPDLMHISAVVVEPDSVQRIWIYDMGGNQEKCWNEGIDSIGYYTWLSKDTMLYYKLTVPHSLRICNGPKEDKWICNSPTRAFRRIDGNTFIYGIKDSSTVRYRKYNTVLKKSEEYAVHKSTSEDFVWHPELGLVKSEGQQLLQYNERKKRWDVLLDFSQLGIKKITRFSFDLHTRLIVLVDNP